MQKTKACLFGGALFAAGLAGTAQAAPEFDWVYHGAGLMAAAAYTYAQFLAGGAYGSYSDYAYSIINAYSDVGSYSAAVYLGNAYSIVNVSFGATSFNTYMSVYNPDFAGNPTDEIPIAWNGFNAPGIGYFAPYLPWSYFTVTEDAYMDVSRLLPFGGFSQVLVQEVGVASILSIGGATPSSFNTIELEAGKLYRLLRNDVAFFNDTIIVDYTLRAIPAPASLALVGLGGLVATRRRR